VPQENEKYHIGLGTRRSHNTQWNNTIHYTENHKRSSAWALWR